MFRFCQKLARGNGARNNLPNGRFQFFRRFSTTFADTLGQHRADFLKESDFITNLQSRVMWHSQGKAGAEFLYG